MYDVIIVGARCAGSPTAMLLARQGLDVLLLDRDSFPSEMRMSTHMIHQRGVARLRDWGLLSLLEATDCPPVTDYLLDFGPFSLRTDAPPVEGVSRAYAPRRRILDGILVDEARDSGAEVREGWSVTGLVKEGGAVSGVQTTAPDGSRHVERGRFVVGADGPGSRVAAETSAEEYRSQPALQGTAWSYWSGVPIEGLELYLREYEAIYGFPTSGGRVLIGANWTIDRFKQARLDIGRSFYRMLSTVAPDLAERAESGKREEEFYLGSTRNFLRKPYGSGWALVGDAGYKKDPCTAQGITDAFVDAELLSEAILGILAQGEASETALERYQRKRDEWALPFYDLTCEMATFAPPDSDQIALYTALCSSPEDARCFVGLITEAVSPVQFFSAENVQRILASAEGGRT